MLAHMHTHTHTERQVYSYLVSKGHYNKVFSYLKNYKELVGTSQHEFVMLRNSVFLNNKYLKMRLHHTNLALNQGLYFL
jgi:hypothetical protein